MSLDADVRLLVGVKPLDALPREALQLLAFSCEKRRLKPGETLFSQNEASDGAFVVLEGRISLRQGETERSVRAGALIGETALIVDTLRPADATAATDAVVLWIPRATFHRVLSEFPQSAAKIHRDAVKRTGALTAALDRLRRSEFS